MKNLKKLIKKADSGDIDAMVEVANYVLWDDMTDPIEKDLFDRTISYLKKPLKPATLLQ